MFANFTDESDSAKFRLLITTNKDRICQIYITQKFIHILMELSKDSRHYTSVIMIQLVLVDISVQRFRLIWPLFKGGYY